MRGHSEPVPKGPARSVFGRIAPSSYVITGNGKKCRSAVVAAASKYCKTSSICFAICKCLNNNKLQLSKKL